MPAFRITYTTTPRTANGYIRSTEWVTDNGWSCNQAVEAFESRHPDASVLRCWPIPPCR
jgi:hypothetical protein